MNDEVGRLPADGAHSRPVLELDDVDVVLAGRRVLDRVNFSVLPGEFTGLIGSNGAGKTTLLRVVLGQLRPSRGEVRIDAMAPMRRNRSIGYVPQKVLLDPDLPLRARDLVELGLNGHRLGLSRPSASRRHAVDEMLAAVGAESFAATRVGRLSGGEQQRILIAHALMSRPRLLLLDEPLANLDLGSGHEVVSLLARLARAHDVAILLSAHEINPLLPVMDRVVYLAEGKAASGTADAVIRSDVLSALYGHHVDVIRVHGRILVVAAPDGPHRHGAVGPQSIIEVE